MKVKRSVTMMMMVKNLLMREKMVSRMTVKMIMVISLQIMPLLMTTVFNYHLIKNLMKNLKTKFLNKKKKIRQLDKSLWV